MTVEVEQPLQKQSISNREEHQVLLYIRAYPGITLQELIQERFCNIPYIKLALSSLIRKGFIEEKGGYFCIKEWMDV